MAKGIDKCKREREREREREVLKIAANVDVKIQNSYGLLKERILALYVKDTAKPIANLKFRDHKEYILKC